MNAFDGVLLAGFVVALAGSSRPMGLYLERVLDVGGRTWLDPVLKPLERLTYRVLGVDPAREQDWRQYTLALLVFSLVGSLATYGLLRCQHVLPLNPQGFAAVPPDLAFNTAASFVTNTNWQSYGGESTMSYLSQMVALAFHHFASAAAGIGIAAALVRGLARATSATVGNFWVDLVRVTFYLLLPSSLVLAVALVSQGMIQNFRPYALVKLVEPVQVQVVQRDTRGEVVLDASGRPAREVRVLAEQRIVQGPMASQVAIKMLGTNGGGYANANAAHPFENPTPLANLLQMFAIFLVGSGLTHYLGRMVRNPAHGWALWWAMAILFVAGALACGWAEGQGNPLHHALGVAPGDGNLEGKEVRFGVFPSALFATITTDASCGAVNAMHDSFTPLGGLIPLFNMQLGGIVFGGVGAGLYGMLVFVVLAVFVAGLMVGRSPEYLGKRIRAYEVKMAMLALLVPGVFVLVPAACASVREWGLAGLGNAGPHGFAEILYAFTSAAGNNGSAFGGLSTNAPWYNALLGIGMLAGRFLTIVPVMALAGSMARQRVAPPGAGTFPVSGGTFVVWLLATILLVGALNFLPALALGPVVEHFLMHHGRLF